MAFLKLPPDLAAADELGEEAVVGSVVADAAGDDGGVDVDLAGEGVGCQDGGSLADRAVVPELRGDEGVLGQGVGFFFEGVFAGEGEVVDEEFVFVAVEVEADVGELVHEAEPEVVDAVVAQGEADDGAAVEEAEGGAVEMGAGEMALDDEGDAVFGEALPGAAGAVFVDAELGDLAHEGFGYGARPVGGLGRAFVGKSEDAPAPGFEGVGVGLGVEAAMGVFAVEGEGGGLGASGLLEEGVYQLFGAVEQVGRFGQFGQLRKPVAFGHFLEGKAVRVDFVEG